MISLVPARPLYNRWRRALAGDVDHAGVMAQIVSESGVTPRYGFLVLISAGIAILGLLQSSPAVIIGAMLISPLMSPILGLGFSLAASDLSEMRRSLVALGVGCALAVLFAALIVACSPLKEVTDEILARTRPNLFDLLIALFAAFAGSFAVIRGRGATITGVAIATALMPPLAVVGYGVATWNLAVLMGSLALFFTNFITIALSAAVMARLYGFGGEGSGRNGWIRTAAAAAVFVTMALPLGVSLGAIGREAFMVQQVKAFLSSRFGPAARITQLDVAFDAQPVMVRAVVIAARRRVLPVADLDLGLQRRLGRAVTLQLDQVLANPAEGGLEAQRRDLRKAQAGPDVEAEDRTVAAVVGAAAGVPADAVTVDPQRRRAVAVCRPVGADALEACRTLEARAQSALAGWTVDLFPPGSTLPPVHFGDGLATLGEGGRRAVDVALWAARRWRAAVVYIPGLPAGEPPARPNLGQRRALLIASLVRAQGLRAAPAPGRAHQSVVLSASPPKSGA